MGGGESATADRGRNPASVAITGHDSRRKARLGSAGFAGHFAGRRISGPAQRIAVGGGVVQAGRATLDDLRRDPVHEAAHLTHRAIFAAVAAELDRITNHATTRAILIGLDAAVAAGIGVTARPIAGADGVAACDFDRSGRLGGAVER